MTKALLVVLGILAAAALARLAVGYYRARGTRVIACPENQQPAAVALNATEAAVSGLAGRPQLRLSECTRWPEKQGCDQACLSQIESSPDGCLLGSLVRDWYAGKNCAYCRQVFDEIHWHDHKPGLRTADGVLLEWSGVVPTEVFDVLKTHQPVCWNCFVAESFRARFPERVIDAPPRIHGERR